MTTKQMDTPRMGGREKKTEPLRMEKRCERVGIDTV
jgi:hypothetical protein